MLVQDQECDICGSNETDLDLADCESCSSLYCDDCSGVCQVVTDSGIQTEHLTCKECIVETTCGDCDLSFCRGLHSSGGVCLGCDSWTCYNCRFDYCVVCADTTAYCCGGRCTKCENMVCENCSFWCVKCKEHTCPNCMSDCKCDDDTVNELICTCGQHKCLSKG